MTQYDFRLSLRSNDPKVVFTGKYLNQFDDMRHRILSKMVDSEYPIALCSDQTKTDQEVLLATIESLSNDAARMAYKVNYLMAARGINITPDMLSNFGLLPAVQYLANSSESSIAGVSSILTKPSDSDETQKYPVANTEAKKESEDVDEEDEDDDDDDDDDDPYADMTDEEFLAATRHLSHSSKATY